MDVLLAANITLSAVVLLTVMYMNGPLAFSSFPSLLLSLTVFRLVLNIGTTRLILTNAQAGPLAAGKVIATFGQFVAGQELRTVARFSFLAFSSAPDRTHFALNPRERERMVDAVLITGAVVDERGRVMEIAAP